MAGALCHHPVGVQERFPRDQGLIDLGIQSYLGVPLRDSAGRVLGHLAVFDERPMPPQPKKLLIFRIFASRAAAELNRLRMEQMLQESELFGHEKGAFTGAIARRIGRFELAGGGTIFLDEVGELSLDIQAKLLRVLQEREFDRVGGRAPQPVDVRVIAATNRDLSGAVREKAFRDDLFYRLNVFPIELPPLRDRKEDIPLLAHYLLKKYAMQIGKPIDGISPETIERLQAYPWPGNIRELENVVERAVILADGRVLKIGAELLPVPSAPPKPVPEASAEDTSPSSLETVERSHILAVRKQAHWRIDGPDGAARVLELHPNTLRSRMKKLGISRRSHDISYRPRHVVSSSVLSGEFGLGLSTRHPMQLVG